MRKLILSTFFMLFAIAVLSLQSCSQGADTFDIDAHHEEIIDWRAGRLERLMAPMGYLNLAGLFWLEPGTATFGSAPVNDLVFPASAATVIGEFSVSDDGIFMTVADGVDVRSGDLAIESILIVDDTGDEPVTITHGSLAWTAVKRDNRYAVRLRDFQHPALAAFGELPYYAVNPDLRVTATLRRYAEPRTVNVGTVIEGLGWNPRSPGMVSFAINGEAFELEAYESGERLFFVFGDATNRDDTYGAGRFLYSQVPADDGLLVLDFNKSYSPPCAFNDFATCPIASPRNRLAVRIEAGEKFNSALHYAAH